MKGMWPCPKCKSTVTSRTFVKIENKDYWKSHSKQPREISVDRNVCGMCCHTWHTNESGRTVK